MSKINRIFFDATPIAEPRVSGIGHMTYELVTALDSHPDNGKKFEIHLVVCRDRAHMLNQWGFKNVKIRKIFFPQRAFNILWKLDLLPPMDLILGVGTYIFPNYKNWRLLNSRSLTFVCDVSYLIVPQYVSPKNQQFLERNINKWVKRTDKVLAISNNAREEIIEHLPVVKEKVILVPCGVNRKQFYKRSNQEISELRKNIGIDKDYILFLSNLEPRKNVLNLIEAYKLLPAEIRNKYSLLLVGGGGWLNEPILEAISKAQDNGYNIVRPKIYIPDEQLPALHSGATLLVHPAFYEGFGIAPLQAMACETPVIAANNSSLPEVVGDAGLLVNALDIQDISDKIRVLLENTRLQNELRAKGTEQVKKYDWNKSAQILLDLVTEMN